jgi:hypothetical protein
VLRQGPSPARRPRPRRGRNISAADAVVVALLIAVIAVVIGAIEKRLHSTAPPANTALSVPPPAVAQPAATQPSFPESAVSAPAIPGVVKLLAIGTSIPRTGQSPALVAETTSADVILRSASPAPVRVWVSDGYRTPLRYWRSLGRGQAAAEGIVSGRHYGYCFEQAAADGYAATRGCGTLVEHETLNGVRLPGGAAETTTFVVAR